MLSLRYLSVEPTITLFAGVGAELDRNGRQAARRSIGHR
jgi:hypothetical protein